MRTLLFDIDGTLLLTNNGGSRALSQAIATEFGVDQPNIDVTYGGRTDRSLLAQLLSINQLPNNQEFRERLQQRYTSLFPAVLKEVGGRVFPGVQQLLAKLHDHPGVHVCVMTGNVEETGREKLRHFDLLKYIQWVSGGQHDADRSDMARRTADMIGQQFGPADRDIIVIGDTAADVQCGCLLYTSDAADE